MTIKTNCKNLIYSNLKICFLCLFSLKYRQLSTLEKVAEKRL